MKRTYLIEETRPTIGDTVLPLLGTTFFVVIVWPFVFSTLIYRDNEFTNLGSIFFGLIFIAGSLSIIYSWTKGLFRKEQFIITEQMIIYKDGPWGLGTGRQFRKEKIMVVELIVKSDPPTIKDGHIISGTSEVKIGLRLKWRYIELGKQLTMKKADEIINGLSELGYATQQNA
jgi:hypothetical protein